LLYCIGSNRRAVDYCGGIYNGGTGGNAANVTLNSSTVSGNTATNGGGIFNYGFGADAATIEVGNSIIADNTADTDPDVGRNDANNATFTDNGNNLIGIDSLGVFNISTLVGNAMNPQDSGLAPLGDYGGPTQTHALLPDSPALDVGDNAQLMGLTTDQRGANRMINTTVDIGAFEFQGLALIAAAGNEQSTTVNTNFATDLQIQVVETFDNKPLPAEGIEITLTAPGTGASASLGSISLTTDAEGLVSTTATANSIGGNYQVGANIGVTEINFDLTNIAAPVVVVPGDSTTNTGISTTNTGNFTTNFTSVLQSVLDELPEYGLEESACTTTPAVVINSKVEEITLGEVIETEVQRNQNCQPVGNSSE